MRERRSRGRLERLGSALRSGAARHAAALACAVAWLLAPEGAWQAARLALLGRVEAGAWTAAAGGGGAVVASSSDPPPCPSCLAYEGAAAEAALARDRALAALAQVAALAAASPGLEAGDLVPAGVRGGAAAARLALASPLARGFSVRLDQGAERGLRPGQPVLAGPALVGRISAVGQGTAEVLLLTAPRFQVRALAVRVAATGGGGAAGGAARTGDPLADALADALANPPADPIRGIASGDGTGGLVFRPAVPGAGVLPGDRVVVDLGSHFAPVGALVGVVTGVAEQGASRLVACAVEPAAPLATLDRVVVVARAGLLDEPPPADDHALGLGPAAPEARR